MKEQNILRDFYTLTDMSYFVYSSEGQIVMYQSVLADLSLPRIVVLKLNRSLGAAEYAYVATDDDVTLGLMRITERRLVVLRPTINLVKPGKTLMVGQRKETLTAAFMLLGQLIFGRRPRMDEIRRLLPPAEMPKPAKIATNRDAVTAYRSVETEHIMLAAVSSGDADAFIKGYQAFSAAGPFGTLDRKSDLRSEKNLLICAITMFTRAAIEGGLFPQDAYDLSDRCIQEVEAYTILPGLHDLMLTYGLRFIDQMRRATKKGIIPRVMKAQSYIMANIQQPLTVAQIAEHVGLSSAYLMRLFKQSFGITMTQFINQVRIKTAENYLLYSEFDIATIAQLVGYNDQAYFTRVFKRLKKISPREYRCRAGVLPGKNKF